jgi:CPA1 family monovalent cation:H+ antiporter
MPWGAAIALGAIVAPPDAAAATTVLKQLRPPHRLLVILEGESLFNDASALLIYRLAVSATLTGFVSGWSILPTLLVVTAGSVVLGLVLARAILAVNRRITDVATAVVVQFCSTFAVWILAERLHLSGIITMVVFAMAASRRAAEVVPARIRVPSWAVWEVAVFVLNVLAFVLVGLQLKSIVARDTGPTGARYAVIAATVCAAVMLARIAWVTLAAAFSRWRCRPRADGAPGPRDAMGLNARAAAVVGWCGMRGTVTLAAALALPTGGTQGVAFPYRDLIIVTAFGVVLGTLVLQGLTLRPLLRRLRLEDDGGVDREVRLARIEGLRAALAATDGWPRAEAAALVRHSYEHQLRRAEEERADGTTDAATDRGDADAEVVRAATSAQRRRLVALRADGTIGDAAFQRVEEELDWAEMGWAQVLPAEDRARREA